MRQNQLDQGSYAFSGLVALALAFWITTMLSQQQKIGEKARFVNPEGSECVCAVNLLASSNVLASLESTSD